MTSRPSLTFSRTRAAAAKAVLDDETSLSSAMSFRRRFPKIGLQYQAKVPKTTTNGLPPYQTDRPRPILMDDQVPYVTAEEASKEREEKKMSAVEPSHDGDPMETAASAPLGHVQTAVGTFSTRGAVDSSLPITLANPTKTASHHNGNLHVTTTDRNNNNHEQPNPEWTTALLQWHEAYEKSLQSATARGRKSRFKRPREVPELPTLKSNNRPNKVRALLSDTVANANNQQHSISVDQAEWRLLVDLQAGQACKRIRERKRNNPQLSAGLSTAPNQKLPLWRTTLVSRQSNNCVVVRGDYRDTNESPTMRTTPQSSSVNAPPLSELQKTWKAALTCAREYNKRISSGPPVSLSSVVTFCEQCRRMVPPEQVWGATLGEHDPASSLVGDINTKLDALVEAIYKTQRLRAELMDLWYKEGVELDVLRKSLKKAETGMIQPDEYRELNRQIQAVADWQTRVEQVRASPRSARNDLEDLEALCAEAQATHAFRSKGLLSLEARLEKSYELRDKILQWKSTVTQRQGGDDTNVQLESPKFLSSLVREIARLKVKFPAASFALEVSETADAWVERANVAIRSRISLKEIRSLIHRGQGIPVDLTEYLDKLKMRESKAQEWLDRLSEHVVVPDFEKMSLLDWMQLVRSKLDEGSVVSIHDLTCEGSRIPVEMDCVHLLQIELDARNWSSKARGWIPAENGETASNKKAKLEDVRDHMKKATSLRNRLILSAEERDQWKLECEQELQQVVDHVDSWFKAYKDIFDNNPGGGARARVSIQSLREIVAKANSIHVNLGAASIKMSKILSQAEKWFTRHGTLIEKCCPNYTGSEKVELSSLKEAVKDAEDSICSLDIAEAVELQVLMERIEGWTERVSVAVGGKKLRGKQKLVFAVDSLKELVKEGQRFPIETSHETTQLENTFRSTTEWKARAINDIAKVAGSFRQLKSAIDSRYGSPDLFLPNYEDSTPEDAKSPTPTEASFKEEKKQPEESNKAEGAGMERDEKSNANSLELCSSAQELIKDLSQQARISCLVTDEGTAAIQLEEVARWAARSLKYTENPREIYDSRFFGAFDRFVSEGSALVKAPLACEAIQLRESSTSWTAVIGDQIERMKILLKERFEFIGWCERAQEMFSGNDKKLTIERLREILKQSCRFPSDNDTVVRVQELTQKCESWIATVGSALCSGEKMPLHEAKTMLEEGNRLGIQSNELRSLRNGVKAARSWANKVKKTKPDQGHGQVSTVKALVAEYELLIVTLPEEFKKLQRCMKNYCICRRQYVGFMIKCEKCSDLFHGACVGVSQARAEKKADNKYVCVRCLVAKVFHSSTSTIAGILRKWTNEGDLRKARLSNAQRHQRKIKKETKELEKLRAVAEEITLALAKQAAPTVPTPTNQVPVPIVAKVEPQQNGVNSSQAVVLQETCPPAVVSVSSTVTAEGKPVAPADPPKAETPQELAQRIEKVTASIKQCQHKLQDLADASVQQRNEEEIENMKVEVLKKWCIRVRSLVLAPSTAEQALSSRPLANGLLSPSMHALLQEAEKHGLLRFADIKTIANSFRCICWSSYAMDILAKQPKASEAVSAVRLASSIKLPDEKGLRMVKAMAQRATAWNFKASRLLMPVPGEKKSYDMKELKNLAGLADDIPLRMPLEPRVQAVIEDEGNRHCLCGGPSDGRLMLSCDRCDRWFHAHCVGIRKEDLDQIDEWKCPPCRGEPVNVPQDLLRGFHDAFGSEDDDSGEEEDSNNEAPSTEKLWPPFGLLGSSKSLEVLGQKLCSFPDDTGPWETGVTGVPVIFSAVAVSNPIPASTAPHIMVPAAAVLGNGSIALKKPPPSLKHVPPEPAQKTSQPAMQQAGHGAVAPKNGLETTTAVPSNNLAEERLPEVAAAVNNPGQVGTLLTLGVANQT